MKHRISLMVLLAALTLPLAPAAFAHDPAVRTIIVDGGYVVIPPPHGHHGVPPHGLRTHVPFQRWYYASRHRHVHRPGWTRLYDIYRIEARHRPARHDHYRGCRHDQKHRRRGRRH